MFEIFLLPIVLHQAVCWQLFFSLYVIIWQWNPLTKNKILEVWIQTNPKYWYKLKSPELQQDRLSSAYTQKTFPPSACKQWDLSTKIFICRKTLAHLAKLCCPAQHQVPPPQCSLLRANTQGAKTSSFLTIIEFVNYSFSDNESKPFIFFVTHPSIPFF